MIIGLSNWGIDVDVTPCLGKGFRIRGTSDVPEYQGKFFISLEIKSFNENGVMVCLDGCEYQAIGGPSLARNSARIEHFGALNQIVNGSHKNFHAFLTALTSWTKAIQPLPRLQEAKTRTAWLSQKSNNSFLAQLLQGKTILQCTTPQPRQAAALKNQASRVTARALSTAGISNESATSRSDAGAAARARPGMNEHCATSLLSLSSFQVHRFFQHPRQHAPLLQIKGMLVRLLAHWLVSMSIVLRHFSHFHSFRFTGSSSIPGNKRQC